LPLSGNFQAVYLVKCSKIKALSEKTLAYSCLFSEHLAEKLLPALLPVFGKNDNIRL
jgi:hypothetical protein